MISFPTTLKFSGRALKIGLFLGVISGSVYGVSTKAYDFKPSGFAIFDAKCDDSKDTTILPGITVGVGLKNGAFASVGSNLNRAGDNLNYKLAVGWQKEIGKAVPTVEFNYDGKNFGYEAGVGTIVSEHYEPFVRFDERLDKNQSDIITGFSYIFSSNYSASVDYTVFTHKEPKTMALRVQYEFGS